MDPSGLATDSLIESVIHANKKQNKMLVYTQNEKSGNGNTDSKKKRKDECTIPIPHIISI